MEDTREFRLHRKGADKELKFLAVDILRAFDLPETANSSGRSSLHVAVHWKEFEIGETEPMEGTADNEVCWLNETFWIQAPEELSTFTQLRMLLYRVEMNTASGGGSKENTFFTVGSAFMSSK